MTRGERVCRFVEVYCRVPEGPGGTVGKPIALLDFQKRFILDIYDNEAGTRRAYLSIARKNGKSALIACLVLAHLVGPEALQNSQIVCGARSRDQAGIIFNLARKMVALNPELQKLVHATPSTKRLVGLPMNVEFRAISAEAGTAHGLSPAVAILDEVGQVQGPHDAFVEAIETAQGAYDNPLLIAISTQAPNDSDLFSIWLDGAANEPHTVAHVYTAPMECDLTDRTAWNSANPALGVFRSLPELEAFAQSAAKLPSKESSFRWLYLNQRVDASSPFVSRSVWIANGDSVADSFAGLPVYGALDLSETSDLTAKVLIAQIDGIWHVKSTFWLPAEGLREKAQRDRIPYDVWVRTDPPVLHTTPGKSINYEWVAENLRADFDRLDVRGVAFDRWNWKHLKPWLEKAGFSEAELTRFVEFGQGFQSMSPALRDLEAALLNGRMAHGNHPVLSMCAANAVVQSDPAGNRKLSKLKSRGRIDGMVALAMAMSVAATFEAEPALDVSAMIA